MQRSNTRELQKLKKAKSGRSEFTRAKLEEEYKPKVRAFKPRIFSLNQISDTQKQQHKIREEFEMCNNAINKLKEGYSIKIDWNTRSNFRTTKSLLPKLKTEPMDLHSSLPRDTLSSTNRISQKKEHLEKLLFKRHKKRFMLSKKEKKEESRLFGDQSHRVKTNPYDILNQGLESHKNCTELKKMHTPRKQQTMIEVQQQILNNSKLKVLKEDLKFKFLELRRSFGKRQRHKKHLLTSLTEEDIRQFHNP